MTCSTITPRHLSSSYSAGVAETKTSWVTRASHSSNRSGRLSIALGSRKPKSTRVSLRDRSPRDIALSCGTVWWDSSTNMSVSGGK
jgi:hypothetical protein